MKKETRGRKPIPIIESMPYSDVIFIIATGNNYPEAISKARGTDSSSTVKQLEALKNAKFLHEPKKEKLLNKTVYTVNWRKICSEYCSFLQESAKDRLDTAETFFPHEKAYISELKKIISILNPEEFAESKVLQKILANAFSNSGKISAEVNIKTLFLELSVYTNTPQLMNIFKKGFAETKADNDFLEKLKEICTYLIYNPLGFALFSTIISRNDLEATKSTEKEHKKSGNTNQNKALSSENKQGENSK